MFLPELTSAVLLMVRNHELLNVSQGKLLDITDAAASTKEGRISAALEVCLKLEII